MSEPLVLLGGPLTDARIFLPQLLGLASERPLTLPRAVNPGSVEAMAEALLDDMPARFALLGHGTGGMAAMEVLRRAPERVSALILLDTDALTDPPALSVARENAVVKARAGKFEQVIADDPCVGDYAARGDCDDLAALMAGMLRDAGAEGYARHVRALQRRPDQQRVLRLAKLPMLLIAGAADPVHPARRMELIAGLVPKSRLLLIPGAGHLVTLEAPDEVNRAVSEFLSETAT